MCRRCSAECSYNVCLEGKDTNHYFHSVNMQQVCLNLIYGLTGANVLLCDTLGVWNRYKPKHIRSKCREKDPKLSGLTGHSLLSVKYRSEHLLTQEVPSPWVDTLWVGCVLSQGHVLYIVCFWDPSGAKQQLENQAGAGRYRSLGSTEGTGPGSVTSALQLCPGRSWAITQRPLHQVMQARPLFTLTKL